jgi:hypothetical protein
MNMDAYKKQIRESILGGASSYGRVHEGQDTHVADLAGSLIAAGPQKVGEVISKMDPNQFALLANKIDAEGLKMITRGFSTGAAPAAPADPNATPAPAPTDPNAAPAAPAAPQPSQELKDL